MSSQILYALILLFLKAALCEYRRVCYYTNWSQYRPGTGRFTPELVPAQHCSHLIYAFADMEGNRLKAYEWNDESSYGMKGMFERFNKLKETQPGLKTLLAVGGWNFGTTKMTAMLRTKQNQEEFITSTIDFLRQRDFDGIDLDFEYPGARGSGEGDKWKFAQLVKDMRVAFEAEARSSRRPALLLTAAVPAGKSYIDGGYDVPALIPHLDFVSVMTYDFHGKWESRTGHNSPLYPRQDEQGSARQLNMEFAVNYWVQKGAPRHKLNVGLPLYGRSFTLSDASKSGINAPARDGGGTAGKYTREKGYLAYYEVCDLLNKGAERFWLDEQRVPYAVKGDQWVGYDDEKSLGIKVDWIRSQGFGGTMVWALDLDDFVGTCGTEKWPLMRTISEKLGGGTLLTPGSLIPTGLETKPMYSEPLEQSRLSAAYNNWVPPNTADEPASGGSLRPEERSLPGAEGPGERLPRALQPSHHLQEEEQQGKSFNCRHKPDGYYRHPKHCDIFYQCHSGEGTPQRCPTGTVFSSSLHVCGFPGLVRCPSSSGFSTPLYSNRKEISRTTLDREVLMPPRPLHPRPEPPPPRLREFSSSRRSHRGRSSRPKSWYHQQNTSPLHHDLELQEVQEESSNPLQEFFKQFDLDLSDYSDEPKFDDFDEGHHHSHADFDKYSHLLDLYGYNMGLL